MGGSPESLGEIGEIMAMPDSFHLDWVISTQSTQEEIQALLDSSLRVQQQSLGVVDFQFGGGILAFIGVIDLLQMMRMIDRVMSVIGLCHCGGVVRGVVEICSICRGRFFLTIPRIESIRGSKYLDFIAVFWRDMIQDSEFNPFMDFNLGVQESRA
jgi:hypothetical protein